MRGKKKQRPVFFVGSLIDKNPGDYIAVCDALTGEVIDHIRNYEEVKPYEEADQVEEVAMVNEAQLKMF